MKKKAGIFKTILVVALIALMLVVGFVSAKYVQNNTIGSFDLAIEKAYTYNLIDGPSFNSIFYNKASNAESVTFCSKAELDQSIFNDLTLTHVGATENDGIFLGVSTDGKTAYVIADSKDPNQKIIANSDCSMMFSNMIVDLGGRPLKAIDLSGLDTSNTTNMSSMFSGCTGLIDLDLSGLDTTNVTDMSRMFSDCIVLADLDLSGFDTTNVTNISSMFYGCNVLADLDLSGFDTTNVTDMSWMFSNCDSLTDLDLSGFDTANVTNMSGMFQFCNRLTTIYASDKFTVDKATNSTAMFFGCSNLVGGKGTAYGASHIDKSYAHIDGGMNNPGYFTDKNAPATTYNLIDGPSFNSILTNSAPTTDVPTPESITFCSRAELQESTINGLTLTHVGATENDAVYLGVSSDGKTAYVLADSADPNQKVIANEDCSYMFFALFDLIDLNLSGLDTSNANDMSWMFRHCRKLTNLNLSEFKTTNVTNMSDMFGNCISLTSLDLSGFETANVTDMRRMFNGCDKLQTIYASNDFIVNQVTEDDFMFAMCENLIGGMGTAYSSGGIDKSYAHIDGGISNPGYFTDKNAPATTYNLIDGPSFNSIFSNMGPFISLTFCSKAQLDQSIFNGLTLTHIGATENDAVYLGVPPKTRAPEQSTIKAYVIADSDDPNQKIIANSDCSRMFDGWYRCALDLSNFDTSKVTDMSNMFDRCQYVTSLDLSGFDTSNVTNMNRMFCGMTHVQTIYASENFVTDQVTDSFEMFSDCYSLVGEKGTAYDELHIDKSYAHIDGGVSNPGYFTDKKAPVVANYILASGETVNNTLKTFAPNATTILFGNNQDLENWKTDNPEVSLTYTTIGASSISEVLLYNGGSTALIIANTDDPAQKVVANQNCSNMFAFLNQIESIDLSGLDTSNTTRMDGMFYKCENLTNLNLSNIDTTKVINMYAMFYECKTLKSVDLSSFNTKEVTNMSAMFGWCDNLEHANVSNFNTENVTDMNLMFVGCRKLAEIDVSGFKTGKVTNMYEMFYGCETVKKLDVTSFDTALVENMSGMFYECKTLESIDLSSFNTSRVTNMAAMFGWCEKLTQLDISSFSTENVTDMHYMFTNSAIQTIYASENFITDQVTNSDSMFNACVNLVGGKGTVYDNSNIDKSYAHIDGGTNNPGYFTDKNAQDNPTIIDTPVLLTWMNTLMTWGERKELKAVINNIDNTDGLQTVLTIENEAGDQIQEPVTLTAKNNEWTVLIDTFAFTEGVYKVTVSEITDPSGEREFTGGFVSSSCVIRISPCQISFSDTSTTIGYGTDKTVTGSISGLPDGELPDCFNLIKVNLVDSYGEITQVPMQIIREDDQAIYRFDIPNNLKAGVYKVYVNLTEVSGYVIGPNDSLEPNIGTIIVSFNTNSLTSLPTETNETNKAEDPGLEPVA